MKWWKLYVPIFLTVFLLSISYFVKSGYCSITSPATVYFGNIAEGTYINFASSQSLYSIHRESGWWFFNNYRFYVETANMTINNFFQSNTLVVTLNAPSGNTSTVQIYTDALGSPVSISNVVNYTYGVANKTLKFHVLHSSAETVTITWTTLHIDEETGSWLDMLLQLLYAGDLIGFVTGCYTVAMDQLFWGFLAMLFTAPLYIRTRSLLLLCIVWILLGGILLVAFPVVSGVAILLLVFGISGALFNLFVTRD